MSGGAQQVDTGGQQQPQQQASDWTSSLAPELKEVVTKNGFTDPGAVVKAYASVLPLLGADRIPVPKDGVWDDFAREKLGIPKEVGGYKYERPKLPDGMAWDENFEKAAVAEMHKAGYTPAQVQAAINLYASQVGGSHSQSAEAAAARAAELNAKVEGWQKTLKTEWGQAHDEKVALAGRAVQHLGGEQLVGLMNMKMEDGTMLGDNPDVLRAFAKIGEQLGESVLKTGKIGTGKMTPVEAQTEAAKIMNSPDYTSKDPKIREAAIAKVNELFGLQYDNTADVRRVATIA